ncbi:3,4-dihydroxy-2-butanone-4-phosphate synthase [Marinovum sp.]|uniref:3,4-dihydroxy-2-butanone-4-phosphate synthase n=1 Tax=Marinovum sp. TaxID=2024839 RepID=UPI003A8CAE6C
MHSEIKQRVEDAIARFAAGEMVIVTDDDDRENEGDLICAAALCTPEKMAFIVRHTCGIVCAPVTTERAEALDLRPMVTDNDAPLGTAFTVTVDVKHGLTTGISAEQRCNTVRALANANMGRSDFVRPGHVFPLIARPGGVLMRSGHTEAATDLCRMAELPEVGVICELANDDGTVMKGGQIDAFAAQHSLVKLSVADLIAYRQAQENLVQRTGHRRVSSPIGEMDMIGYRTPFDDVTHFAFVYGTPDDQGPTPVRLHRSDIVKDVIGGAADIGETLQRISEAGSGVLIYLRDEAAGTPELAFAEPATTDEKRVQSWHNIGLGAQILRDLEVRSIHLIASHARNYVGMRGFGIEVASEEILA